MLDFAARLSRFHDTSELSVLNHEHARGGAGPALLRAAVQAAIWAAERSGGLVDPTLGAALRSVGYAASLDGHRAGVAERRAGAGAAATARVAESRPPAGARSSVDDAAGVIRPPRRGRDRHAAGSARDCVPTRSHTGWPATRRFLVDCGGDIAVGGVGAQLRPYEIEVEHPLSGDSRSATLRLDRGGVATSGSQRTDLARADRRLRPSPARSRARGSRRGRV